MLDKAPGFFTITKRKVLNILLLLLLIYFVFHSIYGSRGIIAYFKLQAELSSSHKKLEHLRAERMEIENRTKLLRHESIDKDMLEEKIRNILGLSAPEEKILRTP